MEPIRTITSRDELRDLCDYSIVCAPDRPWMALQKRFSLWVGLGNASTCTTDEVWNAVNMEGQIWVLFDAAATQQRKPSAWQTVIPGRRPEKKAHVTLGHAKAAVRGSIWKTADTDMEILQQDPVTGKFKVLFNVPQGTPRDKLPW